MAFGTTSTNQSEKSGGDALGIAGTDSAAMAGNGGGMGGANAGSGWGRGNDAAATGIGSGGDAGTDSMAAQIGGDATDNTNIGNINIA